MSVSIFIRDRRDRAVAYALTIRRSQERKYLMALLGRIKLLEASMATLVAANLATRVGELETEVTELNHPDTGAASIADLNALSGRVDDVETILGPPDQRAAELAAAKAEAAAAAEAAATADVTNASDQQPAAPPQPAADQGQTAGS